MAITGPPDTALTAGDAEAARLERYLDPLPRSVMRPGAYVLLDGQWRFERDDDDRGLSDHWFVAHDYTGIAHWPGSVTRAVEGARTEMASDRRPDADALIAWYERDFAVPEAWRDGRHLVQLTFGACGYETRVWLNGTPLTTIEGEAAHLGEYTSFSYELPDDLLRDVNTVTVRVTDSLDPDHPRGKQESRIYKRGGIWYHAFSGPVRSIWLEPVDRNRLRSRLSVVSDVSEGLVEFGVTTRVQDAGTYRLRLVVASIDDDEPCATRDIELLLDPGERRQYVVVHIPNPRLWSPAAPVLYCIVAQLTAPDGHVSQIQTRFGLREFTARGRSLYLNGEPIYLDGILYQPGTATFDEVRRHLLAARELGCNMVRVHITGIDPRVSALADEMGMLLWVEVPSPHRSTDASRKAHWTELQRMLIHIAAPPSVVILSLYNESWGAQDIATSEETRTYIRSTSAFLRTNYPQFLTVDNDGWEHVSTEGRLESALLTAHLYRTDIDAWRDVLDRVLAGDAESATAAPLVVGDPYFYSGQSPVVVSEWGGFGFSLYGGPDDLAERAHRIRAFKAALRARPIAGDVYTQATDIEEEDNGLIDAGTGRLRVPAGLLATSAGVVPGLERPAHGEASDQPEPSSTNR
jgi:beta-galactosidase/beta-glucuronidase